MRMRHWVGVRHSPNARGWYYGICPSLRQRGKGLLIIWDNFPVTRTIPVLLYAHINTIQKMDWRNVPDDHSQAQDDDKNAHLTNGHGLHT